MTKDIPTPIDRSPYGHNIRDQILNAAMVHPSRYGYKETTATDLAKVIGFSKAYIYEFLDSKQTTGEAICTNQLEKIMMAVSVAIVGASSASEKLRRLFRALTEAGNELFFKGRELYDTAAVAMRNRWPSTGQCAGHLQQLIGQIPVEGR